MAYLMCASSALRATTGTMANADAESRTGIQTAQLPHFKVVYTHCRHGSVFVQKYGQRRPEPDSEMVLSFVALLFHRMSIPSNFQRVFSPRSYLFQFSSHTRVRRPGALKEDKSTSGRLIYRWGRLAYEPINHLQPGRPSLSHQRLFPSPSSPSSAALWRGDKIYRSHSIARTILSSCSGGSASPHMSIEAST